MEVDLGKDFNDETPQETETADDTKDNNTNADANGAETKPGKKEEEEESSKSTKYWFNTRKRMGSYGFCSTIKTTTTT